MASSMQANGAEILRLACCFGLDAGVKICAPVHDALLLEAPLGELKEAVAATRVAMRRAGEYVLAGFPLSTDVKLVRYPDRWQDERGRDTWGMVMDVIAERARG